MTIAAGRGIRFPAPGYLAAWLGCLSVPVLGLWLLIAQPEFDVRYEHHGVHFWLVLAAAIVAMGLGMVLSRAARAHRDVRLVLVALGFQFNAAFLGLHALATPGIVLAAPNTGFLFATPVGLVLGSVAAVASAVEYGPVGSARLRRLESGLAGLPVAVAGGWALLSLTATPPLDAAPNPDEAQGLLVLAAFGGSVLYLSAAVRYAQLYLQAPRQVLLSVLTAFVLLSEALFAVGFGRNWRASWWEWHLLMVLAFGLIAWAAHRRFRREGSALGLFDSITLRRTMAVLERDYAHALEAMVDELRRRADGGVAATAPLGAVETELAKRFSLTERQLDVLRQSARALGSEREQVRKLGALVAIGAHVDVIAQEQELLRAVTALAADAFGSVRLGLRSGAELRFPDGGPPDPAAIRFPLHVKGVAVGELEAPGPLGPADTALLASFASQISVALENVRLYQQLDGLFRSYMSPAVATALLADPSQAGLGGRIVEVSVLFADLRGFTNFAEQATPDQVVAMLNAYYAAVVPVILDAGGTVVQFVGDAVMALFNAPVRQPDHAERAARAGLGLHRAVAQVAAGRPDWPRFRVGINTGPALVGNIGADRIRNFTAIGDTTNTAARLESLAAPGTVVVGPLTRAYLGPAATALDLGELPVKGKQEPVRAYVLEALADA